MKRDATIKKNLDDLFDGERCSLSRDAMIILTAFGLHNYGGSDEALEMCIAGSWAALFRDIGYNVSSEQLAKACPKSRSFGRYELHLASDCLTKVIAEIKQDKAEMVGIIMDHGHRGGQDHFVIVVVWSGYDNDCNQTFKFFCPSIDSAGHSAEEVAKALKKVLDRTLGGEVEIFSACADSGGGGSIDNSYPFIKRLQIMKEDSKETNCAIHG